MAVETRPELVGKRFLCVAAGEDARPERGQSGCGSGWRAGVIRAVSHRDSGHPDLAVRAAGRAARRHAPLRGAGRGAQPGGAGLASRRASGRAAGGVGRPRTRAAGPQLPALCRSQTRPAFGFVIGNDGNIFGMRSNGNLSPHLVLLLLLLEMNSALGFPFLSFIWLHKGRDTVN